MSEADRAFATSWRVVDALNSAGMSHACVSPGSRSTPIALALSRHPEVEVHVHLDERASAFFALGLAKSTGRPVAAACTSGTAVAELFPAVVEASMSRTPLVLLTADRPPELRGVGANQTIVQPGIFGGYVGASLDLPVPGDPVADARWDELLGSALAALDGPPPRPVHLNLPFREPLVPSGSDVAPATTAVRPATRSDAPADDGSDATLAFLDAISGVERGILLAGTCRSAPSRLVELSEGLRWPLIAEPTSGVRVPGALSAGAHLLADAAFVDGHVPDLVVQFGAAPTSRSGLELVRRADRLVIVDPDHLVADPHRRASLTLHGDPEALIGSALAPDPPGGRPPPMSTAWSTAWSTADAAARAAVDAVLHGDDVPFEGRIARDVGASLPTPSTLVVGSSMPVRDLDAYMAPRDGVRVIGNRGASGIDGFVSTALGVATATEHPTAALLGDLTFLYDAGGLLWSGRRGPDIVLVVVNNDGGGIFSLLPHRGLPELDELFVTPHGLDLSEISAAAGVGHRRVERSSELVPAIDRSRAEGGVRVVEIVVDRDSGARTRELVRGVVASALRSIA
ncbi:MAG TPA: 2-succinyl-5-enolpyruvyl-6-hydroxy-3-cyclohexene-1-carboxylic-acid synthase [Actinomycetota bacterium]|nr:2-succinyl-5-enolpyruvyl-6-hydroxy-3-cyclohexene-1-carboxylic-acid synthase [Actinomycetota bacterium]